MALGDRLMAAGRVAATAAADALLGWAENDLGKAGKAAGPGEFDSDEGPETAPGGSQEETAESSPVPTQEAEKGPKALFWDPFAIVEQLGYKERPSQISYGTLRAMVWRMPVVQTIIQTRINQIATFCRPQRDRYQMGFRIMTRDPTHSPTKEERKWSEQMTSLILRTGITDNPRGRDDFETFIRRLAWDSYAYDQCGFEIVPNRRGQPAEWYALDGSTLRLADISTTRNTDDRERIRYVQVYDGMIVAEYNQDELAFGVRNPRTDIRLYGYGTSELEMLITTVTALLWGWEYNQNAFRQGSVHKGLLNFKGAIAERELKAFRRYWYQMLSGVENSWRTPIVNAEDVQWVPMHASNRDMEYNAWMDFLLKVTCAMYAMDPSEINFKYGNVGQRGGLGEASNKEKINESKERGLRPILRFFSSLINKYLIWPLNESFEFEFVGLDARTNEAIADLNMKRVKTLMTIDELRAEDDLPPLPDKKGEIILDPTWLQASQAASAQQGGPPGAGGGQPPEQGEEGGGEGGEEGGEAGGEEQGAEGGGRGLRQDELERLLSGEEKEKSLRKSIVIELSL